MNSVFELQNDKEYVVAWTLCVICDILYGGDWDFPYIGGHPYIYRDEVKF